MTIGGVKRVVVVVGKKSCDMVIEAAPHPRCRAARWCCAAGGIKDAHGPFTRIAPDTRIVRYKLQAFAKVNDDFLFDLQ